MNTHIKKEILLAVGTFLIAGFCMFYEMTPAMYVGTHAAVIGIFILLAVLTWQAKATDEREQQHKAISSDIAFTVAGSLLAIGMMYQIYTEMQIDPWLMTVLTGMISARVISRIWLDKNN